MSLVQQHPSQSSSKLLIGMGGLWFLLAVAILVYQFFSPAAVVVEWRTETEVKTAGFYIYRSTSADGEFILMNEQLLPSQGDALSGASYHFEDNSVAPGQVYYYLLEEVELDGTRNQYPEDIQAITAPRTTWWVVILTSISVLVGLALIISGIKEERN